MQEPIIQEVSPGTYWWCQCGQSKAQPFCDGSHEGTGVSPIEVKIDAPKKVAWCVCKRTGTPPFCDGSHARQ
jgi:CDGSH-type Zn-finger protein